MEEDVNWNLMGGDIEEDELDPYENMRLKKESKKEKEEAIASYIG